MAEFTLRVNGRTTSVDVEGDTPLLWVLREELELVGTKYGCGMGLCHACTVHLDGQAVNSCQVPVSLVGERQITTIEGLSSEQGRSLQRAWVELDVPQCGYCQSGQLMKAASLLAGTLRPTDADIDTVMSPNLCRCGTYNRIRAAIHRAAGEPP